MHKQRKSRPEKKSMTCTREDCDLPRRGCRSVTRNQSHAQRPKTTLSKKIEEKHTRKTTGIVVDTHHKSAQTTSIARVRPTTITKCARQPS